MRPPILADAWRLVAAIALAAACGDRTSTRDAGAAGADSAAGQPRVFSIADSAASDGGRRRPGQCARSLADPASGVRLTLRGWDERVLTREGDTTTTERYQHGYYTPADARAVGLAPGQEYEVDCRTLETVGVNTPDLRPAS